MNSTPEQLRFPPAAGFTVRADFTGGEVSSDLGALILSAVDARIGLVERLSRAIKDSRDPRYITHSLRDLLTQRVFQIASGYEDGNDANALRHDPLFKLAAGRAPLDADTALACGATHSRLEGALGRCDIYRLARALVEQFIAGYPEAPRSITLDMDHTDDATYGQQALSFYNHHYGHHCFLPITDQDTHASHRDLCPARTAKLHRDTTGVPHAQQCRLSPAATGAHASLPHRAGTSGHLACAAR